MPESTPLSAETKAARASSFGGAASLYERCRPGPPFEAVEWVLPERVGTVVDLGAGTGALTRLLVGRVDQVVAVEPDDRMRAVLAEAVPGARAVAGRGEAIPQPDGSVDAVLASSSWHWMETVPTLREIARVLVPGGVVSAMWSGPDPDSGLVAQAQALLGAGAGAGAGGGGDGDGGRGGGSGGSGGSGSAATAMGIDEQSQAELSAAMSDQNNLIQSLEIPPGLPFDRPEKKVITWNVALNADELIGLLGTFSWVILMDDTARERLFETARRVLKDALGVSGDATVDVGYRAEVFKARRHD